jgi:large subunit ribosomal protein L21
MYAIIEDGGQQYKVEEGQELALDFRDLPVGTELKFERVLAVRDERGLQLGEPVLASVSVIGEVAGVTMGKKLYVQEFRRRKNVRRRTGHRQLYTRVKINKIAGPTIAATVSDSEGVATPPLPPAEEPNSGPETADKE